MPVCGFNEKMLKGLAALTEGLIEHGLIYRCEKNNETIEQGIKREISDMARLIPELNRIDDTAKRIMTEGIIKYAQGFYMHTRKTGIENYKANISRIMDYFKSMDSKFYSELEGKSDDMKKLALYMDELSKEI